MLDHYNTSNLQLSDFVPLGKIGQGSFSEVMKVRNINDGRIYALKKIKMGALKPKEQQYAINEIKILASVQSDYVVSYKWSFYDRTAQYLCIVMEWANEGDLHAEIQRRKKSREGKIPQSEIWRAIHDMLIGLSQLHSKCIIHRDIKTANIFKSEGIYKIGDLNIAKICPSMIACTQTGTPYYASPEVWNEKPYNEKSDIWSFGCVIYEMCEMQPPFHGANMQKLFQAVNKGRYRPISCTYSQNLVQFISMCLKVNPNQRYSCKELLNSSWAIQKMKQNKIILNETSFIQPSSYFTKKIRSNNPSACNYQSDSKKTLPPLQNQSAYTCNPEKKKYRLLIKNTHDICGIRPKRNLKTSQSRDKENESSLQEVKRYHTRANDSNHEMQNHNNKDERAQIRLFSAQSGKKRSPGSIRSIVRPFSASKANNSTKQKFRVSSSKQLNKYCSVKSVSKTESSKKNLTCSADKIEINQQESHRGFKKEKSDRKIQSIIVSTRKQIAETGAKQADILKKLISNHEQKFNKPLSKQYSELKQRPMTSIQPSNYENKQNSGIARESSYRNVTSKQQLRKDISRRYQIFGSRNYISRPNSNYSQYSQNNIVNSNQYMANLLNKIKR